MREKVRETERERDGQRKRSVRLAKANWRRVVCPEFLFSPPSLNPTRSSNQRLRAKSERTDVRTNEPESEQRTTGSPSPRRHRPHPPTPSKLPLPPTSTTSARSPPSPPHPHTSDPPPPPPIPTLPPLFLSVIIKVIIFAPPPFSVSPSSPKKARGRKLGAFLSSGTERKREEKKKKKKSAIARFRSSRGALSLQYSFRSSSFFGFGGERQPGHA